MKNELMFDDGNGHLYAIGDSTLLVFLDETGEETMSDPNAPLFGIGGLIVEGRKYFNEVESPWHELKNKHFSGRKRPLHAAELRNPSIAQIEALNNFFTTHQFGRIANTCVDKTINKTEHKIEDILMALLWDRIKEVANTMKWTDIFIIFEENHRLLPAFTREFMSKVPRNSEGNAIKVSYKTHLKDASFAGMEVADFIIHTAGREARLLRTKLFQKTISISQPDFKKVFSDKHPISYLNLSRASISKTT